MSDHAAVEHKSHWKEYFIIFLLLTFLTVVEIVIPGLDTKYAYKASALIFLAIGKAFIVAYYYMHLKDEKGWLKFIAAIPISAGLYALVVILESIYR